MTSIDNRIVSVKFDNAGFQEKVASTQASLNGLNQSLQFNGAATGIGDITTGLNRLNFGPLSVGVDGISTKLLALATVGATVFAKLASAAVDAGTKMIKGLTLTPILDGFKEYNTNIGSIQTILANTKSKGSDLDDVTRALDELNTYSDQTIYNFGQMTENIGKFTAAGVDLDTSVASIKGFANISALSGATAEESARATYQLSQAMAAGTIRLQDWRSLEMANTGGEQFKTALFETAKAMGALNNVPLGQTLGEWEKANGPFRESLESGWLSADVMSTTLTAMTGDLDAAQMAALGYSDAQITSMMDLAATAKSSAITVKTASQLVGVIKESIGSGWSESFRNIIGDFEQAKALFSGLYEYFNGVISKSSDARNYVLKGWSTFGGRDNIVASLLLSLKAVESVVKPIGQAFREFFPRKTVTDLLGFSEGVRKFTEKLILSESTMAKVKNVFSAFFSSIKVGITVIKGIFGVFGDIFGLLNNTGTPALAVMSGIGETITKFNEKLLSANIITGFFSGISSGIQKLASVVSSFLSPAFTLIGGILDGFAKSGFEGLTNAIDKITSKTFKLEETFDKIKDFFSGLFPDSGSKKAEGASKSLDTVEKSLGSVKAISESLNNVWQGISEGFSNAFQAIKNAANSTVDAMKSFWSSVTGIFSSKNAGRLGDAVGLGLAGGILYYLRKLVNDGIDIGFRDLINKVGESIDGLTGALESMQQKIKADALLSIAKAILVIAISVGILSLIDPKKLGSSLTALVVGFTGLMATMAAMDGVGIGGKKFLAMAAGLTLLSGAILLLSISMLVLSTLEWPALAKGLVGLAGVLLITAAASRIMGESSANMISTAIGLGILAGSLMLLSLAIRVFDKLNPGKLIWGLTGIAATLLVLTIALRLMPDDVAMKSLGLAIFAFGLKIMADVVEKFGSIGWWELVKGLYALGAVLLMLMITLRLLPKDMVQSSLGILAMAVAIKIIGDVVLKLGEMGWFNVVKGIGAMAIALILLVATAHLMKTALPGAYAVIVMAGALWIMAQVLEKIGNLSLGNLLKGLLGVAGIFVILGLSAVLLTPVIPAIMALAIALGVLGLAFALIGIGAYAVAKAFKIFADSGTKGIAAFKGMLLAVGAAIPTIITGFVLGVIGGLRLLLAAIPGLVGGFVIAISAILGGIIQLIPKIMAVISAFIDGLLALFIEKTPLIVAAGFNLIMALLNGVRANLPAMLATSSEIIINFLNGLAFYLPQIIEAGKNLIVSVLKGLTDSLPEIATAVTDVIVALLDSFGTNMPRLIMAGALMIIKLLQGIGDSLDLIIDEGVKVVLKFIQGLNDNIRKLIAAGFQFILDFITGLTDAVEWYAPLIKAAVKDLGIAIIDGFKPNTSELMNKLKTKMLEPFKNAWSAVEAFFRRDSPSKESRDLARDISAGFILGLRQTNKATVSSTEKFGKSILTSLHSSLGNTGNTLAGVGEFTPTIKPVLDLTGVRTEAAKLDGILSSKPLSATVSYDQAAYLSTVGQGSNSASADINGNTLTEIKFEQNNYSPEALSVNDIYRQTRNQIELAKQELNVS